MGPRINSVAAEAWRVAPLEIRIAAWGSIFIAHPNLAEIIRAFNERLAMVRAGGKPRGILVLSPPDGGKTTLAKHLVSQKPRFDVHEKLPDGSPVSRTVVPIVSINTPNPCIPLNFANAILKNLDSPLADGSRSGKQCGRAIEHLRLARTELVVIDNMQDIPERKGPVGTYNICGFIRNMIDEANVVAGMLGTDIAEELILANPQLQKRVPGPLTLGQYDVGTPDGLAKCLRLQHDMAQQLPLADPPKLGSGHLGRGLACASDGKVGTIHCLLESAIRLAFLAGRETLTEDDLRTSYKALFLGYASHAGSADPFAENFVPRRLNQPGEPHYREDGAGKAKRRARR